jgi:hypothetical protein
MPSMVFIGHSKFPAAKNQVHPGSLSFRTIERRAAL